MSVLFISHKYPPSTGGMEKQSLELIEGFAKISSSYKLVYEGGESKLQFFIKLSSRIHQLLKLHPDIQLIHLNDGLMATVFMLLRINIKNVKIAVTFHGLDVVFPLYFYQKWVLPKLSKYDAFICVSSATRDQCLKRGFDENKLFIIHNGVSNVMEHKPTTPKFLESESDRLVSSLTDDKYLIVAVGRPVRRKGFSWFAQQVMPLLGDRYVFLHIGDISYKPHCIMQILPSTMRNNIHLLLGNPDDTSQLIHASRQQPNVITSGKISHELKEKWLKKAKMIVMPNISVNGDMEGFGLVALEAAIQGIPVLASALEGITDAVHHGKNGFLVQPGDAAIWAATIKQFSDSNENDPTTIKNYTAKMFSWEKMVDEYKILFDQLGISTITITN